jgi:branched-chain amino acid transport system substrate-binding protein
MTFRPDRFSRAAAPISRRRLLHLSATAAAAALGAPVRAALPVATIRVGCTLDLSTTERHHADALHEGARVAFDAYNRDGGWRGRHIELARLDDQSRAELAAENARQFAADPSVVALLQPIGNAPAAAVMDAVQGLPIVGPHAGSAALREKPAEHTFFVRADHDQEVRRLVEHARAQGLRQIGAVAPGDPLGEELVAGLARAAQALELPAPVIARTPDTDSLDVQPAARELARAQPQTVLVLLGRTAASFVAELRTAGGSCPLFGLSIAGRQAVIGRLGPHARGFGFAMVVPSPFQTRHGVARGYQRDLADTSPSVLSLPGLEGYINARVLIEGLRRAPGPAFTRGAVLAGLQRIGELDLGGFRLSYAGSRRGSRFVDVGVLDAEGRLLT